MRPLGQVHHSQRAKDDLRKEPQETQRQVLRGSSWSNLLPRGEVMSSDPVYLAEQEITKILMRLENETNCPVESIRIEEIRYATFGATEFRNRKASITLSPKFGEGWI